MCAVFGPTNVLYIAGPDLNPRTELSLQLQEMQAVLTFSPVEHNNSFPEQRSGFISAPVESYDALQERWFLLFASLAAACEAIVKRLRILTRYAG